MNDEQLRALMWMTIRFVGYVILVAGIFALAVFGLVKLF